MSNKLNSNKILSELHSHGGEVWVSPPDDDQPHELTQADIRCMLERIVPRLGEETKHASTFVDVLHQVAEILNEESNDKK